MGFVLYNEELGYMDMCPVFENSDDASHEAASKCRLHSVREINDFKPCKPAKLHSGCLKCMRCSSTIEARQEFLKSINNN